MSRTCLMIIDPGVQLWGSERALAATLRPLTEVWDQVILVTPPGAGLAKLVKSSRNCGPVLVEYAAIGLLHRKGLAARVAAMLQLGLLIAKYRPDQLYLNQAGLCRLLRPIARLARLPLALHVRLREDLTRVGRLRGTAGSRLHLIYISDSMLEAGRPRQDSCTSVYQAYDPYLFAPDARPASGHVAEFVSVGRLSRGKGPHLLVDALSDPELIRTGAVAHVFGEGVGGEDYVERLRCRVAELSLGDRLVFQGFCSDVTDRLGGYRFLVSTSEYESLGRVVMEAWEAGLVPIVYSGSGGAAEIVRKSGGGLLYEEWTAASLAQVLRRAKTMTGEDRRAMALAGLNWGKSHLELGTYRENLRAAIFCPPGGGQ